MVGASSVLDVSLYRRSIILRMHRKVYPVVEAKLREEAVNVVIFRSRVPSHVS